MLSKKMTLVLRILPLYVKMPSEKHFVPLESDPEIFTELMHGLGVSRSLSFTDVWSLEDDTLAVIPRPVLALILVLPPCPAYKDQMTEGQTPRKASDGDVVWFAQTINNACGLYAILHAVCNMPEFISQCNSPGVYMSVHLVEGIFIRCISQRPNPLLITLPSSKPPTAPHI